MSAQTAIEWTDRTWNPVRGCSRVSAGCVNCYAERQAVRQSGAGKPYEGLVRSTPSGPRWTGAVRLVESVLREPFSWSKPQRVFVNSMSDLFHEGLTDGQIDAVFKMMAFSLKHTFQVLTKRPERMRAYVASATGRMRSWAGTPSMWPLPNVWLGVSVEDQQRADERIPLLLQTPAAVRFVSAEPLLGPVDFDEIPLDDRCYGTLGTGKGLPGIDWVIVGGESGPGARPCDVAWIRSIVEQCKAARVACFVKQVGSNVRDRNDAGFDGDEPTHWPDGPTVEHDLDGTRDGYQGAPVRVHLGDRKGGDPAEWPEDLRVRKFPEPRR